VWFKNFVLSSVAQHVQGRAINLVVDNDVVQSPTINVLSGSPNAPRIEAIPIDDPGDEIPWEARRILNRELFRSFRERVRKPLGPFLRVEQIQQGIIVDRLWTHVTGIAERQEGESLRILQDATQRGLTKSDLPAEILESLTNLGSCLSQGRHDWEQELGLTTRDLPIRAASSDKHFLLFFDRLVGRHEELHAIHNSVLATFRASNHIRSRSHPVPDMEREDDWYEIPFWAWTHNNPRRRKLFARRAGQGIQLTDRAGLSLPWPPCHSSSPNEWSYTLHSAWIALRPRALITTMYARLVLSDLFIHGIGGAKYDEVTDEIIRRFFGIEPPKYITATATFRLPIERPHVTVEDVRDVRQKLRAVRYRPEAFLRDPLTKGVAGLREQLQALADEKREYVRRHNLRRCEAQVFARLDTMNRAMHDLLQPVERELLAQQAQLSEDLRRAELLGSREFSFVLFPAEELPQRLLALSKVSA
jgi:hypothetical protein